MDTGPGVVKQARWKPLGFLPNSARWWLGVALKGGLAMLSHNIFDAAVLGHDLGTLLSVSLWDGQGGLSQYMAKNPNVFSPEAAEALNSYMTNNPLVNYAAKDPLAFTDAWKTDLSNYVECNSQIFDHTMKDKINEYAEGYISARNVTLAKAGGFLANSVIGKAMGMGNDKTRKQDDSWLAYGLRKIIPGAIYCALFSATYGTLPMVIASFVVTTAMTDFTYKVLGEGLLGLAHIK